MRTQYPVTLLASLLVLLGISGSASANPLDDILGGSPSVPSAAPAPAVAAPDGYMPDPNAAAPVVAAPDGSMPDPNAAAPVVAGPDGYMPDPTAAAAPGDANAAAAPAQPEVPQLSQADKDSQLWLAAKTGDSATVASMLQQGANINTVNESGATPLHAATAYGSLPLVMYLVKSGADINATTHNGWTALHHAARFGKADIANYLRGQGLNPNQATSEGKTAVQMALDNGDLRTARILGY
jgi:hypothetical protein